MGTDVGVEGLERALATGVMAVCDGGGIGGVRFLLTDLMMSGDESVVRLEMAPAVARLLRTGAELGGLVVLTGMLAGAGIAQLVPPVRVEQLLGVDDRLLLCRT